MRGHKRVCDSKARLSTGRIVFQVEFEILILIIDLVVETFNEKLKYLVPLAVLHLSPCPRERTRILKKPSAPSGRVEVALCPLSLPYVCPHLFVLTAACPLKRVSAVARGKAQVCGCVCVSTGIVQFACRLANLSRSCKV